jgi:tetratricopeptide (TPR) repeat protein
MAVTHPQVRDPDEVLALLARAAGHIQAERLAEAASCYRQLLLEPALSDIPAARIEVLANYGALLLHEARMADDSTVATDKLDQAIDMLSRARAGQRLGQGGGKSMISDTNLALAYFQRHLANGQHADLMAAHLALDGAEADAAPDEPDLIDWIRSIRQLLLDQVDRRRELR